MKLEYILSYAILNFLSQFPSPGSPSQNDLFVLIWCETLTKPNQDIILGHQLVHVKIIINYTQYALGMMLNCVHSEWNDMK